MSNKTYKIAVIKGDGIGPEVVEEGIKVLNKVSEKANFNVEYTYALAGGIAIDKTGTPLPEETLKICRESDAVLLGSVGGQKWDLLPGNKRPEKALLGLRSSLGLYANLRPAILHPQLIDASPLKRELIQGGINILVVRELTGGIYFGKRGTRMTVDNEEKAYDIEEYTTKEIERIANKAFELALIRGKLKGATPKVVSVDKANVLDSSRLWRKTVNTIGTYYPQVELSHMYIDNCAMQLIRDPKQFDVILTNNMFGDILSDEASQLTGSIGMLPSASLGNGTFGMYEPIHGSAPDIAGKNIANPLATILSVSLMLKYSLGQLDAASLIDDAVDRFLNQGYRTKDLGGDVSCSQCGSLICNLI